MKYDFQTVPQRRHTNSIKWDIKDNELPMWVADMDFKVAPEIVTTMKEKIDLEAFGYERVGDDYYQAIASWYQNIHHSQIKLDWMLFTTGVVPAISSIIRRVSNVGDNVLVQEPVYNIFYNSIENNGRHVLSNDLVFDGETYQINWEDLESKLSDPLTTIMLFCNPHNPIGKVWSKEEVSKIAQLCQKHHVVLLSDEIHGDLIRKGPDYTPAFSVEGDAKNNVISLVSPSKTFNVAALHAATIIVPDDNLRASVSRGINNDEIAEPNLLAIPGSIAAYTKAITWYDELIEQLNSNFGYAEEFIRENIPEIKVVSGDATYLIWLDVEKITNDSKKLADFIRKETGLFISAGNVYRGDGNNFLRMNLASPLSMVKDGMNRLAKGIKEFKNN